MVMCDRGNIADVEVRPEGSALWPGDHPDARLHTNHYLTSQFAAHETNTVGDSRSSPDQAGGADRRRVG